MEAPHDRLNYDEYGEMIIDTAFLSVVANECLTSAREHGDFKEERNNFIRRVITEYYSPLNYNGITSEAGHIIYRLSDLLNPTERQQFITYPTDDGSLIDERNVQWDTLEDWRRKWATHFPFIPELHDMQKNLKQSEILTLARI